MAFQVGQRAECIRQVPGFAEVGDVFTVSYFDIRHCRDHNGVVGEFAGLLFYEISPKNPGQAFNAEHFRPLTKSSTDTGMAIFRRILNGQKQPVDA